MVLDVGLEPINAARMSAAGEGSTEPLPDFIESYIVHQQQTVKKPGFSDPLVSPKGGGKELFRHTEETVPISTG